MPRRSHRRPETPHWNAPKGSCRWCGEPCLDANGNIRTRANWHSECVDQYKLAAWSSEQRKTVRARDKGICCSCGVDAVEVWRRCSRGELFRRWSGWHFSRPGRQSTWDRHSKRALEALETRQRAYAEKGWTVSEHEGAYWQADHIRPLALHRGDPSVFGPDNLQTLCAVCHKAKTAQQARSRGEVSVFPTVDTGVGKG